MDVLFIFIGLALLIYYIKTVGNTHKPLKFVLLNSLSGVASLGLVSFITSQLCSQALAVNLVTSFISTVLGIPGTLLMTIDILFL